MMRYIIACLAIAWSVQSIAGFDPVSFADEARVPGEILITFTDGISHEDQDRILARHGAKVVRRFKTVNGVLARMPENHLFLYSAGILAENKGITRVAPNRLFHLFAEPDDPRYESQYQHEAIQAPQAWDISTGSKDVVVAVIDSGIIDDHEDLAPNIWVNPGEDGLDAEGNNRRTNGIDDDGNGYIDDFRGWDFVQSDNDPTDGMGHGTHCAGIIGAIGNNGVGVAGINWQVSLVSLRIFDNYGNAAPEDRILAALEYAAMMGFPIVSNSWGGVPTRDESWGPESGDMTYEVIRNADKALWVFAAGNSSANNERTPVLPATYDLDHIVSVAASTSRDRLARFSNYGSESVDLMAPGDRIYSTSVRSFFGSWYYRMSGTSMAAPVVSGAAALLLSVYPDADPAELKERLMNTVDPIRSVSSRLVSGGRLNLYRALTE